MRSTTGIISAGRTRWRCAGHTTRQRAYAEARGDRQVYTPQAVVDGAVHALGSDKSAIERAIRQTRDQHAPLTLPVAMSSTGDSVHGHRAGRKDDKGQERQAEVWLCPVTRSVPVAIGRGENSGRTLTYTNVVRRWIKLGDWSGKAATYRCRSRTCRPATSILRSSLCRAASPVRQSVMLGAAQLGIR